MDKFPGWNDESIMNLSSEPEDVRDLQPEKEPWHPEKARMQLAYRVLIGISVIFILTLASYIFAHFGWLDVGVCNSLFEFCKTGLLPIVTLILGYYFSQNN